MEQPFSLFSQLLYRHCLLYTSRRLSKAKTIGIIFTILETPKHFNTYKKTQESEPYFCKFYKNALSTL